MSTQDPGAAASQQPVEIEIDWSDEPPPVYSNGVQIVHTPRDFSIAFSEFSPFAGRRVKPYPARPGEIAERARVVASVRMTPDVFLQLIAAGAANWNKFVETHGKAMGAAGSMPTFEIRGGEVPPRAAAAHRGDG